MTATIDTVGIVNPHQTNPGYERAYARDWFWKFNTLREWLKLRTHVVGRVGLRPGACVLEVACGQGYHVNLLRRMGYHVTGVDISEAAIGFAQRHFPKDDFRRIDAAEPLPLPDHSFDLVWSHGAGFFHYCLTDSATEAIVRRHLRVVKPGGHYLVMISTNLSGDRPKPPLAPYAYEWQHTTADVRTMLEKHGDEVAVDWFPTRRWIVGPKAPSGTGYVVGTLRVA